MKLVFKITYDTTVDIGINDIMRAIEPNFDGVLVRATTIATVDNIRDDISLYDYDTLLGVLREAAEACGWKNIQIERIMEVSDE